MHRMQVRGGFCLSVGGRWRAAKITSSGGASNRRSVGKHFKTNILGYPEAQQLAGVLSTEVKVLLHKESESKGKQAKKIIV